jgi:hypothetical protein
MRDESEANWCLKFINGRKNEKGNKAFVQNNERESQIPLTHPSTQEGHLCAEHHHPKHLEEN